MVRRRLSVAADRAVDLGDALGAREDERPPDLARTPGALDPVEVALLVERGVLVEVGVAVRAEVRAHRSTGNRDAKRGQACARSFPREGPPRGATPLRLGRSPQQGSVAR